MVNVAFSILTSVPNSFEKYDAARCANQFWKNVNCSNIHINNINMNIKKNTFLVMRPIFFAILRIYNILNV